MEKKETAYIKIIQRLITETADAILFWTLFQSIRKISFSKEYPSSFNFIQIIKISSSAAFMVQLAKLIDKKGISINYANSYIKKFPCLFHKSKEETKILNESINTFMHKHETIISNITNQRNRFHVHIDTEDIKDTEYKVFRSHKIELTEIDPFLSDLCICIGKLANQYRNEPEMPFYSFLDDETIKNYLTDKDLILEHMNMKSVIDRLKF